MQQPTLESDAIFANIKKQIQQQPETANQINAAFLFKITKDGKHIKDWTIDLKTGAVYEGEPKGDKPNAIVTIPDDVFVKLSVRNMNPQQAYMQGDVEVTGNIMWMQKLWIIIRRAAMAKL